MVSCAAILRPVDDCCGPQPPEGYEEIFDDRFAKRTAREYRRDGLSPAARRIIECARSDGLDGVTVLEVGGGVGAIQVELLLEGAARTTNLELSGAYEAEAAQLLDEHGVRNRAKRVLGVDLAVSPDAVEAADFVILHRVVCCYENYEALLTAAARKARRAVIFSYPRRTWYARAEVWAENLWFRATRNPFRAFVHVPESMIAVLERNGFEPRHSYPDRVWSVTGAVRV